MVDWFPSFIRFNVKNLLDHEFFAEGELKVEVVEDEGSKGDITFRMEVPNRENKKESKHESVEFSYSLHSDVPESVVEEMVQHKYYTMYMYTCMNVLEYMYM